jgi:acetoin utilization deacetylase AcuC-like enzyme
MLKTFDPRQLAHAPALELHNGGWVPHAEKVSRSEMIAAALGALEPAQDFGIGPLRRVHAEDYLSFLAEAHHRWIAAGREGDAIPYTFPIVRRRRLALDRIDALLGQYCFDASTPIGAGTWDAAYWSAQSALTALQPLLGGAARTSFALCRPPGHHAGRDYCGGYCYLNSAAIAARAAADAGLGRIAILDVDYHHGNGTQDIFYADGDIYFASLHADPATDYPYYWGHADETGEGAGAGATLNLPLPRGTEIQSYLAALDRALEVIAAFSPGLLVVSFGADTFEQDPISHFALRTDDYPRVAERIDTLGLPTLIVMEGGYAVEALGRNVAAFLDGFGH